MKLNEITNAVNDVITRLCDEETGELNEEAVEQLNTLKGDFDAKIDAILYKRDELKAIIEMRKSRIENLKNMNDSDAKRIEKMEEYIINQMHAIGETKHDTKLNKFSVVPYKHLEVDDELLIPEEFFNKKESFYVDKTSIKKYIEEGGTVNGCHIAVTEKIRVSNGKKKKDEASE